MTAVVLFTRDLRVHDNPALDEAARTSETVVPVFVVDDAIVAGEARVAANRLAFLLESLTDLRAALERRGGTLVIRRGNVVHEALRVARQTGATHLVLGEDVSGYAADRAKRLERACREQRIELRTTPGVTVVPSGDLTPAGRDHYSVFTPYLRRWLDAPRRSVLPPPRRLRSPTLRPGRIPRLRDLTSSTASPARDRGGETVARRRLAAWLRGGLARYEELKDTPAADATSRLSAYLHFGCLSPLEVATRAADVPGSQEFVRQLAWRDFFHQLLDARPETSTLDMHPGRRSWGRDDEALAAWREGSTGVPLVDAGMRQLLEEGFMHGRARLVAASHLTKTLNIDWRAGAAHFAELLTDGDVASNTGNWQWAAGTGADTRPNRILNPARQAARYDPDGSYVRRYGCEDGRR